MATSKTPPSDSILALRCQLGEQEAWEALVVRWNPKLRSFVSRMLSEQHAVEDVLQSVWLKTVRSISRLEDPGKFSAWIYRITRLTITDQLRRQYRMPLSETFEEPANEDPQLEQLVVTDQMEAGLEHLHPAERESVVLHYFEHLTLLEVAEICGVPLGTVKSRLHRAREILRRLLESEGLSG